MTPQQSFHSEEGPTPNPVPFDRLRKIFRARGQKTATGIRSAQERKHRRDRYLITANESANERAHQRARIEARPARRNHSSSSACDVSRAARADAIVTIQTPLGMTVLSVQQKSSPKTFREDLAKQLR